MADYDYITYETLDDGQIARIMLNPPAARNAQHRGLLVELGEAFTRAEEDDEIRVVNLGGLGPMFSSGHDMGSKDLLAELTSGPTLHPTRAKNGGARLGAEEAYRLGMITKIFPPEELTDRTVDFARRIARLPTMTATLVKESVNQSVDNMGFYNALNAPRTQRFALDWLARKQRTCRPRIGRHHQLEDRSSYRQRRQTPPVMRPLSSPLTSNPQAQRGATLQ